MGPPDIRPELRRLLSHTDELLGKGANEATFAPGDLELLTDERTFLVGFIERLDADEREARAS